MLSSFIVFVLLFLLTQTVKPYNIGSHISLNGIWDFEQTRSAFPPVEYTRKCPVPGLIHLATPKIEAYDNLFQRPDRVEAHESWDYRNLEYEPQYSWYNKYIEVLHNVAWKVVMIHILKSKYVTKALIDLADQRYFPNEYYKLNEIILFRQYRFKIFPNKPIK